MSSTIRNWYIYIVNALALNALAWSSIALIRDAFIDPARDGVSMRVATSIAVLLVATPLFATHWWWARRVERDHSSEDSWMPRAVYIYGMMAAFLGPALAYTYNSLTRLFRPLVTIGGGSGGATFDFRGGEESIFYYLVPLLILAALWLVHLWLAAGLRQAAPDDDGVVIVGQIYSGGFAAAGLVLLAVGLVSIVTEMITSDVWRNAFRVALMENGVTFLIGVGIWLAFGWWPQRQTAARPSETARNLVRGWYYALVLFVLLLSGTLSAGILLGELFSLLGNIETWSSAEEIVVIVASTLVVSAGLWAYHMFELRRQTRHAPEAMAEPRRSTTYLSAAVGLATTLGGTVGLIYVIVQRFAGPMGGVGRLLRTELLSWILPALLVGIPLWLTFWLGLQRVASSEGVAASDEVTARSRQLYLYGFMLAAVAALLGSAAYLVAQLVGAALGARPDRNPTDLYQAVAYAVVAGGVLAYHLSVLRQDRATEADMATLAGEIDQVLVIDTADGAFGSALLAELKQRLPGSLVNAILLNGSGAAEPVTGAHAVAALSERDLIVGPWNVVVAGSAGGAVDASLAQAVVASPAHKLLVPRHEGTVDWAGVDDAKPADQVRQVVSNVMQLSQGKPLKARRNLGCAATGVIIIAAILIVQMIVSLVEAFFPF